MPQETSAFAPCPHCGARYPRTEKLAGRKILCKCGAKIRLPADASSAATLISPPAVPTPADDDLRIPLPDVGDYGLERAAPAPTRTPEPAMWESGASITCPSCDRALPGGAVICVPCGINAKTGRPIITAEQGDTELIHSNSRSIFWFLSWVLFIGLFPVASEAHGAHKPHAVRTIAALTILISAWFWIYEWSGSSEMGYLKQQLLWAGDAKPDADYIEQMYEFTDYGDRSAFHQKKRELSGTVDDQDLALAALDALPRRQKCLGTFEPWQLISHALLHADLMHLAGNLLFLLVFGNRINAMIGNVGAVIVYPLLAIAAALAQIASMSAEPPSPMLGASGAIMGLAGMYFVLFPVNKVHVAWFVRVPIIPLYFHMWMGFWKVRGFWILLLYIGLDAISVALASEDGTAHWAHMGGFICGMVFAIALLAGRAVNARGNDLFSVTLGKHAWFILGRPSQWQGEGRDEGWLQRLRFVPESVAQQLRDLLPKPRQARGKPTPGMRPPIRRN